MSYHSFKSAVCGVDTNRRERIGSPDAYDVTEGEAPCALLCGDFLNTSDTNPIPYRIGPGTYVPLMFDPTGGEAWCAALCGILLSRCRRTMVHRTGTVCSRQSPQSAGTAIGPMGCGDLTSVPSILLPCSFDVGRNIPSGCPSLADGSTVRDLSVDGGDF